MSTPSWLERPRYRERVVASKRGWIVERTGEVLVSVVAMDEKLRQYFGFDFLQTPAVVEDEKDPEPVITGNATDIVDVIDLAETPQKSDDAEEPVLETNEVSEIEKLIDDQPEQVKKRRGRPRKNKEESK